MDNKNYLSLGGVSMLAFLIIFFTIDNSDWIWKYWGMFGSLFLLAISIFSFIGFIEHYNEDIPLNKKHKNN